MIELTEQQLQASAASEDTPLVLVDPKAKTPYVLLRQDEYERLIRQEYDDTPWSDDEMELLAWEVGEQAGWRDMDDYDHYPEKR